MKKQLKKPVLAWSTIAIALFLTACGSSNYNIESESDRKAMMIDIRNALTYADCAPAITNSTLLYNSAYSNNEIRMLYASAHACNIGIQLYTLIDSITHATLSSPDEIFRSFVKIFPSKAASDSRMQSSWYAMDALQSILKPGVVVAPSDATYVGSHNPGSIKYQDRTDDANAYMVFISMAAIGTSLNRNGYAAVDDPVALGYHQAVLLPWTAKASVLGDPTFAACSLASGMYNLFDSISATGSIVSANLGAALNGITGLLKTGMDTAALTNCLIDFPGMNAQCAAGIDRLKFRGACVEQPAAASATGGVISVINAGWL